MGEIRELQEQASKRKGLTEDEKAELTIRIEKILGKPPHNMITEVIVKELVEKFEDLEKRVISLSKIK